MNRNLNHAMLCSTYAICKIYDVGKTFHEILISYKELNNIGKEGYNDILEKIPYEGDFVDIITFYNKSFIKKAKGFILEILEKGKTEKTKNYINNPVKQLLSHNVVAMAENITMTPGSQTPFTQQLRAYNESPLFIGKKVQQGLGKFLERQNLLQKK